MMSPVQKVSSAWGRERGVSRLIPHQAVFSGRFFVMIIFSYRFDVSLPLQWGEEARDKAGRASVPRRRCWASSPLGRSRTGPPSCAWTPSAAPRSSWSSLLSTGEKAPVTLLLNSRGPRPPPSARSRLTGTGNSFCSGAGRLGILLLGFVLIQNKQTHLCRTWGLCFLKTKYTCCRGDANAPSC